MEGCIQMGDDITLQRCGRALCESRMVVNSSERCGQKHSCEAATALHDTCIHERNDAGQWSLLRGLRCSDRSSSRTNRRFPGVWRGWLRPGGWGEGRRRNSRSRRICRAGREHLIEDAIVLLDQDAVAANLDDIRSIGQLLVKPVKCLGSAVVKNRTGKRAALHSSDESG